MKNNPKRIGTHFCPALDLSKNIMRAHNRPSVLKVRQSLITIQNGSTFGNSPKPLKKEVFHKLFDFSRVNFLKP